MKNSNFQKIAFLHFCTIAATTSSFAATTAIPSQQGHWYYSITGLYQQPNDNGRFAYLAGPPLADFTLPMTNMIADYTPTIGLSLGCFYTPTDDISLHFEHANFNKKNTSYDSTPADATNTLNGNMPFFEFTNVRINKQYNALNLRIGRLYSVDNWNIHLFGGVDYTHIKEQFRFLGAYTPYNYGSLLFGQPRDSQSDTTFHGIGPQIGLESSYKLNQNVNLTGGINLSLLAGNLSYISRITGGGFLPGDLSIKSNNAALKAQANLGVSYEKIIQNKYLVTVELGYKTLFLQSQSVAPDGGERGRIARMKHYSFSMSGPYLGIKVSL